MIYKVFLLYSSLRSFLNELMECIHSEEIEGIFSLTASVCIVIIIKGQSNHLCPIFSPFFFLMCYILKAESLYNSTGTFPHAVKVPFFYRI